MFVKKMTLEFANVYHSIYVNEIAVWIIANETKYGKISWSSQQKQQYRKAMEQLYYSKRTNIFWDIFAT